MILSRGESSAPATSQASWRVYNIGNQNPVELLTYIETLEKALGKTEVKEFLPLQPGDVPDTYVEALVEDVGYKPNTPINEGIRKFVDWYLAYHQI
jgi:UDP-glucuronate 4-epimerase